MSDWESIIKTASIPGADLRGAKGQFPTKDSTAFSEGLLHQSQKSVPTPALKSPRATAIKFPSIKGSLPKLAGAAMNTIDEAIANDPLTQYMAKVAEDATVSDYLERESLREINDKVKELFASSEGLPKFRQKERAI